MMLSICLPKERTDYLSLEVCLNNVKVSDIVLSLLHNFSKLEILHVKNFLGQNCKFGIKELNDLVSCSLSGLLLLVSPGNLCEGPPWR